jgi:hypothetical protein
MPRRIEQLVEVRLVTEWKDGYVWETKPICEAWIEWNPNQPFLVSPDPNIVYAYISTERLPELNYQTLRTKVYD